MINYLLFFDLAIPGATLAYTLLGLVAVIIVAIVLVRMQMSKGAESGDLTAKFAGQQPKSAISGRSKYPSVDILHKSGTVLNIGLIASLLLTVLAFSWTSYPDKVVIPDDALEMEEDIEVEHLNVLKKKGVTVRFSPRGDDGRLDLLDAMEQLADAGINDVLLETGSALAGSFLQAGLVDEIIVYMAPKLLGSNARPLFQLPLETMDEAVELTLKSVRQIGQDLRLVYHPTYLEEDFEEEGFDEGEE